MYESSDMDLRPNISIALMYRCVQYIKMTIVIMLRIAPFMKPAAVMAYGMQMIPPPMIDAIKASVA
jgi:hypothetical protein